MHGKPANIVLSAWLIFAGAGMCQDNGRHLTVTRENVNLRAKPSMAAEVVAQVSAPDKLTVISVSNEWVEVVPPPHAELWVLGDYVRDGIITCKTRVNVRSGAGINFNIVGRLTNGAPVSVRGSHADWVKIAPPEAASLWIARSMVEFEPADTAEPAAETPAAPAIAAAPATPVTPDTSPASEPASPPPPETPLTSEPPLPPPPPATPPPAVAVKPPPDLDLHPGKPQGQWRQYEGILRPRNFIFGAPSRYRLAQEHAGVETTICHVRGNEAQLRALLNRRMAVSGREYWVKRPDTHPVLVPERIVLK